MSKIGIGSYGVGGRGHRDMTLTEKKADDQYLDALVFALQSGSNFTEISLGYGHGQALSLFKQALDISLVAREDIFLTHSLYPRDLLSFDMINNDIRNFHQIVKTDYADSTLVTQSLIAQFGSDIIFPLLHHLLKTGKTRYVSLSNASPNFIKLFYDEFSKQFIAHEGHLSFEVRALQDKGVFAICSRLGITNIIWRPLRRNATQIHNWPLLDKLAKKYQKKHNQIILNWICHLGYHPMVMSASKKHIDENLASLNFQMTESDYKSITDFRPTNYHPPEIDWEKNGHGDSIVTLVNDFDQHVG